MMTAIQMHEKANHYFRQARRELDDRHLETLFDLAVDFDTFARDLESWERNEVSARVTAKSEKRAFLNIINFFGFTGAARSGMSDFRQYGGRGFQLNIWAARALASRSGRTPL